MYGNHLDVCSVLLLTLERKYNTVKISLFEVESVVRTNTNEAFKDSSVGTILQFQTELVRKGSSSRARIYQY